MKRIHTSPRCLKYLCTCPPPPTFDGGDRENRTTARLQRAIYRVMVTAPKEQWVERISRIADHAYRLGWISFTSPHFIVREVNDLTSAERALRVAPTLEIIGYYQ